MNKKHYYRIVNIVEDIELTNKLISDLKKTTDKPTEILGFTSILRKKRRLIKKLLGEMIDADISFNKFEKYYLKVISSLKSEDKKEESSKEILEIFDKMDKVLATP